MINWGSFASWDLKFWGDALGVSQVPGDLDSQPHYPAPTCEGVEVLKAGGTMDTQLWQNLHAGVSIPRWHSIDHLLEPSGWIGVGKMLQGV